MNDLLFSFSAVFPLFGILLIGYILKTRAFLNEEFIIVTNKLCFRLLMPIVIFSSIYSSGIKLNTETSLINFAVLCMAISILVLFILVPIFVKSNNKRGVMIQGMFRSNFLYFGIPVITNIYGGDGVAQAIVLNAVMILIFNIASVFALEVFDTEKGRNIEFKKIIKNVFENPLVIASIVALLLVQFDIILPIFIIKTLKDLSAATVPMALLVLGASFNFRGVRKNLKYIFAVLTVKLVLIPVIIIIVSVMAGFKQHKLLTLVMLFASPIAIASHIMAADLGGDSELAGQLVILSTAVGCLTLFVIIYSLKIINLL